MKNRNNGLYEAKPQRWRALIVFNDGKEGLLRLGQTFASVQESYDEPFFEQYEKEERDNVKSIVLQKWIGTSDSGKWVTQRNLDIPDDPILNIGTKITVKSA